jgi:hypothetical protein
VHSYILGFVTIRTPVQEHYLSCQNPSFNQLCLPLSQMLFMQAEMGHSQTRETDGFNSSRRASMASEEGTEDYQSLNGNLRHVLLTWCFKELSDP